MIPVRLKSLKFGKRVESGAQISKVVHRACARRQKVAQLYFRALGRGNFVGGKKVGGIVPSRASLSVRGELVGGKGGERTNFRDLGTPRVGSRVSKTKQSRGKAGSGVGGVGSGTA